MKSGVDKKSGSIAFNRLDLQISQAIHMAIELYDSLDYLLVLDYDDDITLFDNQNESTTVSYYQVKTKDDYFTLNTILDEDWLTKLHNHLSNPERFVRELGLITNCYIKLSDKISLKNDETKFKNLNDDIALKIKKDIATKKSISIDSVDLSKFIHIRTSLSIDRHKDVAEKEMGDFLYNKYKGIKVETIKTIFNSVLEILTKRQEYEKLGVDAEFGDIKAKKGFSRTNFKDIIDIAIKINIPSFSDILSFNLNLNSEKLALAYVKILADNNSNTDSYRKAFDNLLEIIENNTKTQDMSFEEYINLCSDIYTKQYPLSMYNENNSLYIKVLTLIIIINKQQGF